MTSEKSEIITKIDKIEKFKTRSFLLTVSPKGDIHEEAIRMITRCIQKQSDFHHIVIEQGSNGKAHLHAIMLTPKVQDKQKMQQNIWSRFVKPYCDAGTIGGVAVKVQVAPGPDWYTDYLKKEDTVRVISTHWDAALVDQYFPDPALQQLLQESQGQGIGNNWVVKLLSDYKSECNVYTFHTAYVFLHKRHRLANRMFQFRTLREHAKILASYALEDDEPTMECIRWNTQMDGGNPQNFAQRAECGMSGQ
jgi:hypothetical protein